MRSKKKRFPTSVKILGRVYKIKQGNNLQYYGKPCYGLCDNVNKIIYLEKDQDDESKQDTAIHEMTHAFLFIAGIDQLLTDNENEIYAQLFTALYRDIEKAFK